MGSGAAQDADVGSELPGYVRFVMMVKVRIASKSGSPVTRIRSQICVWNSKIAIKMKKKTEKMQGRYRRPYNSIFRGPITMEFDR